MGSLIRSLKIHLCSSASVLAPPLLCRTPHSVAMTATREARVWVDMDAEYPASFVFSDFDELRQTLDTFCRRSQISCRIIRFRQNRKMLTATGLLLTEDPVEILIQRTVPRGEHSAAVL